MNPEPTPCTFDGCPKPARRVGLCWGHDTQVRRGQELRPLGSRSAQPKLCTLDYCDKPARSMSLCPGHYRQQHDGEPLRPLLGTLGGGPHACTRHRPGATCYELCGCRCSGCKAGRSRSAKRHRAGYSRRVDPCGTRRRLQALAALGWDCATIATLLGIGSRHVVTLRSVGNPTIRRETDRRVRAVYEELSARLPPDSPTVRARRTRAARDGWAPPLAWDDDQGPHGIDNPDATPYAEKESRRRDMGEVEWLIRTCSNPQQVAERAGYEDTDSLYRYLHRNKRLDLWEKLMREAA